MPDKREAQIRKRELKFGGFIKRALRVCGAGETAQKIGEGSSMFST